MTIMRDKLLFDRQSIATALSISLRSVDYLIESKRLVSTRLGKRVLVHRNELEKFARMNHYDNLKF